jgi:hypothetical protein
MYTGLMSNVEEISSVIFIQSYIKTKLLLKKQIEIIFPEWVLRDAADQGMEGRQLDVGLETKGEK